MKKALIILSVLLVLSLASCAGNGGDNETTTEAPETTEAALPDVKIATEKAQLADPQKFVSEMENYGAEVADMSDAGGGYIFTFTTEEHKKLLEDKRASTEKAINEFATDEESYVEKIEFNEDFRDIKVFVNREKYDMSEKKSLEYNIAANALAYQIYTNEWQSTFVKVVYSDNEETVTSFSLPVEISFEE